MHAANAKAQLSPNIDPMHSSVMKTSPRSAQAIWNATEYVRAAAAASVCGIPPGKGLLSSVARALVFGLFAVTAKGRRFNPCSRLLFCCVVSSCSASDMIVHMYDGAMRADAMHGQAWAALLRNEECAWAPAF